MRFDRTEIKFNNLNRTRIDLTRYTETHTFTFDDTFDSSSSNTQVMCMKPDI